MSAVVVWLTKGGCNYLATPDVDVAVIDFQNLEAGDPLPTLSDAHKALLKANAPSVLGCIAKYAVHYRCDNCEAGFNSVEQLKPVENATSAFTQRGFDPAGECPLCGGYVLQLEEDWWPIPQSALDRHFLSGRFNLAPEALPLVNKIGLDRVLAWFETTRGVNVGDTLPVGDFGLSAFFGFDPDKPNGECCYVNITVLR